MLPMSLGLAGKSACILKRKCRDWSHCRLCHRCCCNKSGSMSMQPTQILDRQRSTLLRVKATQRSIRLSVDACTHACAHIYARTHAASACTSVHATRGRLSSFLSSIQPSLLVCEISRPKLLPTVLLSRCILACMCACVHTCTHACWPFGRADGCVFFESVKTVIVAKSH